MQAEKKRPKPAKVRKDPRTRHIEGVHFRLINPDPEKKYVVPSKHANEFGVGHYEDMGYEIEHYKPGGVKLSGRKREPGEQQEYMGCVLMSIDQSRYDEIDQYGITGLGGQERADETEARIIDRNGGADGLRGMQGAFAGHGLKHVNQTGALEDESPL